MSVLASSAPSRRDWYAIIAVATAASGGGVLATWLAGTRGIALIAVLTPLAITHYLIAVRRNGLLSPDGLFFAAQLIMAVGTFQLADSASPVDVDYADLIALACATYIAASLTTYLLEARGTRKRPVYAVKTLAPRLSTKLTLFVAVAVVLAYFQAVGYSAFFVGLQGQLDGQSADVASLRLDSYATGRYLFPGYVNQFKNAILPGLSLVFATWAGSRRSTTIRMFSWALILLSIVGLLWTGQRGAFVSFILTATVYALLYNRRRLSKWALVIPLVALPLVLIATAVLARGGSATQGIIARFLNDNQLSGLAAYRYTAEKPTQWGAEWGQAFLGVLPGNRGSTLSGEVFATLYGSTRGTSPPSLWGSIHYNFGTVGVVVAAALLGIVLQRWTRRGLRNDEYNTLQLVGFAGATVTVGTWIADGPTTLLNTGLVAYGLLWWWGSHIQRRGFQSVEIRGPRASN